MNADGQLIRFRLWAINFDGSTLVGAGQLVRMRSAMLELGSDLIKQTHHANKTT